MPEDAAPLAEPELSTEERRVWEWREKNMLKACDGAQAIAEELLRAGVHFRDVDQARARGVPLEYLARILA